MSNPDVTIEAPKVETKSDDKPKIDHLRFIQKGQRLAQQLEDQDPGTIKKVVKKLTQAWDKRQKHLQEAQLLDIAANDLADSGLTIEDLHNASQDDLEAQSKVDAYRQQMRKHGSSAAVKTVMDQIAQNKPTKSELAQDADTASQKYSLKQLSEVAADTLYLVNLKDIDKAIFDIDQEAISIMQGAFEDDELDSETPGMAELKRYINENRDYTFATQVDRALAQNWLEKALGKPAEDVRQDQNLSRIRQLRLEELVSLATDTLADPNKLGKLYHQLEISTQKKFPDSEMVDYEFDGKTYQIAKELVDNENHRAFINRLQKSRDQIDYQDEKTQISGQIDNLPPKAKQAIDVDALTLSLDARNPDVTLDDLADQLNILKNLDPENTGDEQISAKTSPLIAKLESRMKRLAHESSAPIPSVTEAEKAQEYLDKQADELARKLDALSQLIGTPEFNPQVHTPQDLLQRMAEAGGDMAEMAEFMTDNPEYQKLLYELVKAEKTITDNNLTQPPEMHAEWEELNDPDLDPTKLAESLIDPSEIQKIVAASQEKIQALLESGQKLYENGKLKVGEVSKTVIEAIKAYGPDLLKKAGMALLVVAVAVMVVIAVGIYIVAQSGGR